MTTQGTDFADSNAPHARKTSPDGRSGMEAGDIASPELKHKLRQMVDDGKARAAEWKGSLQHGIREKPIQSVLIAAAVGAVVGVLIGRRSS